MFMFKRNLFTIFLKPINLLRISHVFECKQCFGQRKKTRSNKHLYGNRRLISNWFTILFLCTTTDDCRWITHHPINTHSMHVDDRRISIRISRRKRAEQKNNNKQQHQQRQQCVTQCEWKSKLRYGHWKALGHDWHGMFCELIFEFAFSAMAYWHRVRVLPGRSKFYRFIALH